MTAQCNDKFRPCRLDHLAKIGEWRAAEAIGTILCDSFGAVRDPDDVAPQIPQDAEIGSVVAECQWFTSIAVMRLGMLTAISFERRHKSVRENLTPSPWRPI